MTGAAGLVTLTGFGSLLSEVSARSTFGPHLRNFRLARIRGFRRVFAHPASVFFERGIGRLSSKEIASLSTEPAAGGVFLASVFDVPRALLPDFYAREEEFRIVAVPFEELDGRPGEGEALMCTRWTDDEYIQASGILPCRVYLRHCLLAVEKLGAEVSSDFADTTFLGDRATTIREYVAANPSIMDEQPPAHLVGRYSG
ncbi:hypothetical protein PybrP1_004618 [[Pythium] brassicae (nom. inval.)]|nr:hypothetical protein PybrP1_004618 [[Pythium] brassicae (nom. inval.)]